MQTIVVDAANAQIPLGTLVSQASPGGVELRGESGELIAFVLPAHDRAAWAYAAACNDIDANLDKVRAAVARKGGISTEELLQRAQGAAAAKA
jgi:hypothetical protein